MAKDKVSIIVPVYNTEKYVKKCLESIINQTHKNIEVIVINDGSPDDSEKIILDIIKDKKNFKYKKIKNGGVANARNVALDMCTGDYVAFIDSDDYIDKTMIEKLYSKAKDGADIVSSGYKKLYKDHTKEVFPKDINVFGMSLHESKNILLNTNPYITNKLFSRDLIVKNNISFDKDLRIFEDLLFCYKLHLLANKIDYVNEALYNYNCLNESSLTRNFTQKMYDVFEAMDRLRKFYHDKSGKEFDTELEYICIKHMGLRFFEHAEDKKLKLKYIDKVFEYYKENFDDYKKCSYYKESMKCFLKKFKTFVKLKVLLLE